jgi:hydrogenase expression/formation protein HypC
MCLAVPGKIVALEAEGAVRTARVDFGGAVRRVQLDFVPDAAVGEFVLVHVGFAIGKVDAAVAQRTRQLLAEMDLLEPQTSTPG